MWTCALTQTKIISGGNFAPTMQLTDTKSWYANLYSDTDNDSNEHRQPEPKGQLRRIHSPVTRRCTSLPGWSSSTSDSSTPVWRRCPTPRCSRRRICLPMRSCLRTPARGRCNSTSGSWTRTSARRTGSRRTRVGRETDRRRAPAKRPSRRYRDASSTSIIDDLRREHCREKFSQHITSTVHTIEIDFDWGNSTKRAIFPP